MHKASVHIASQDTRPMRGRRHPTQGKPPQRLGEVTRAPYAALLPYQRILRLSKVKNLFLTSYKSNEERSLHYNKVEERPPSIMGIACCWKPVRRCLYNYSFEIPPRTPPPFCFILFYFFHLLLAELVEFLLFFFFPIR